MTRPLAATLAALAVWRDVAVVTHWGYGRARTGRQAQNAERWKPHRPGQAPEQLPDNVTRFP
ncbi:MAG: hypothetical protein ACKOUS_02190, partial [Alphaproteobacteria bacterium]